MKIKEFFRNLLKKFAYYPKWRCINCGKEIFDDGDFCEECKSKLPVIKHTYCEHCGRELKVSSAYCTTCVNYLTAIDTARSVYNYKKPISTLIVKAKYGGKRYILDAFSKDLKNLYLKSYFNADLITYVPMTDKAEKKRGYNQSKILAENLSKELNVPIYYGIKKTKDTPHQAGLKREERLKNLKGVYRLYNKKQVKSKIVLIVDDVTTTGATAQNIADLMKKAGASRVFLLTVASVPTVNKY